MKIAYIIYEDPWISSRATDVYDEEELHDLKPVIFRSAGIIIEEDDSCVKMGEIRSEEDNPQISKLFPHPQFSAIIVISKRSIIHRQDFDVPDDKKNVVNEI